MFHFIRHKFGPITVSLIVGFIAFVFIFFGFYTPGESMFGAGRGTAATVNGDPITMGEFSRAYENRMKFYEDMMKGKIDPSMFAKLGLKKGVLDDLVRQRVLIQEAKRQGLVVSDQEVAFRIAQMPYFQREGRFDKVLYNNALKANGYSPGRFEDMVREEIALGKISDFLRGAVKVSEGEVQDEFWANANQRQVSYVVVSPAEQVTNKEDSKNHPASKENQTEQLKKRAEELAQAVRSGGATLKSFLSKNKISVKETEPFSASQAYIPGLGEVSGLKEDAFAANGPLHNGPKIYENYGSYVVVWGLKKIEYTEKDFPAQRDRWYAQVRARKDRQFYDSWVQDLVKKARVKYNEALLSAEN